MASADPDIQLALQHAVGQANNPDIELSKKRKKKRDRGDDADDDAGKERKKKRKKGKQVEEIAPPEPEPEPEPVVVVDGSAKKKKKERKKGKGKQRVQEDLPTDAQLSVQLQESELPSAGSSSSLSAQAQASATATFLSALVAAASAPSEPPNASQHPFTAVPGPNFAHPPPYMQYPPPYGWTPAHVPPSLPSRSPFSLPFTSANPFMTAVTDPALSNDDILRALQELDLTKIANVLKTIGDAAAAANAPNLFASHQPVASTSTTYLGQQPTSSAEIMQDALSNSSSAPRILQNRVVDMSLPGPLEESQQNPHHAQLLATKWLNTTKLAELVKTHGLVYKKGKFSAVEESQVQNAVENWRVQKALNNIELNNVIYAKDAKSRDTAFWSEITAAVPLRPIIAVYHHVRRTFHPLRQRGKWMPEEDKRLQAAVAEHGQAWERVCLKVGRMSSDCRDRYRNHIAHQDIRTAGTWSKEEEEELTKIVTEMTVAQGKSADGDIFWGHVAERMGNKRNRQQVRIKWTDALNKTVKNEGQKPRWSQHDAYILVHKISSLNVRDDTEIDWKLIPDKDWNLWSAHLLQRRWLTLKRSIKGHEEMTHQEIMDILRTKKAHVPPMPTVRRTKGATSAAIIEPDEDAEGVAEGEQTGTSVIDGAVEDSTAVEAEVDDDADGSTDSSDDDSDDSEP